MQQLPDEDDTPFSLPSDVPEIMPIDYPQLDSNVDQHEAYDEGTDDLVDSDPYREDDNPIKSTRKLMKSGAGSPSKLTVNHDIIRKWIEQRGGKPYMLAGEEGFFARKLKIVFPEKEPGESYSPISWKNFFTYFEKYNLALLFKTKSRSGEESQFYKFIHRAHAEQFTNAKWVD